MNLIFSIDVKNELNKNVMGKFVEKIDSINKHYSEKLKFFISLGNENFVLFAKNFDISKLEDYVDKLLKIECIKKISTTILINEFSNKNNKDDKTENNNIVNNKNLEFVMYCKVRCETNNKKTYQENIEKIRNILKGKSNIIYYLKFGIYDLSIKFNKSKNEINEILEISKEINEYVEDIQIEPIYRYK